MPRKFTYFAPGTHVWIYTQGEGRAPGTVVDRQSGVYRVKFDGTGDEELRKASDIRLRRV